MLHSVSKWVEQHELDVRNCFDVLKADLGSMSTI